MLIPFIGLPRCVSELQPHYTISSIITTQNTCRLKILSRDLATFVRCTFTENNICIFCEFLKIPWITEELSPVHTMHFDTIQVSNAE